MTKKCAFVLQIVFFFYSALSYAQEYEILGIGAPCMDILIHVDDEFLASIDAKKGGSKLENWETFSKIIEKANNPAQYAAGGSASNTIKGLRSLGQKTAICGKIGSDEMGQKYIKNINHLGIIGKLVTSSTPTQQVAAFITPDHQRTFRVFPGAAIELSSLDLTPELFRNVKLVHIEGYALYNGSLVRRAMELAKEAGALVSFDMASFEVVQKYKETILELISSYADIVFANEDEAKTLTGLFPSEACDKLKSMCKVAVILVGEDGCWVGSGDYKHHSPAVASKVIDTTGAGDLFASGFLHGYLEGCPLDICAQYGNLTGGAVVEIVGAEIPEAKWKELREQLLH